MNVNRRDFMSATAAALGGLSITGIPAFADTPQAHNPMRIQDVIDLIVRAHPPGDREVNVDTVKIGDPSQPVSGIATTFLSTASVIREAAERNLNLVITHEPTFYNHLDETDWLESDSVYRAKVELIDGNDIVVWRLHDHLHRLEKDDLTEGVFRTLGWEEFADPGDNYLCTIPESSLNDLATFLKERVGTESVRTVGDPEMRCRRVAVLMGAWGGRRHIEMLSRPDVDVLVCGEANEWETPEYVRDANALGIPKGLVVVGHALSEEPGMYWFTKWLREQLTDVPVVHLPAGDPFAYL